MLINIPDTDYDPETGIGTLVERITYETGISVSEPAATPHVLLCMDGRLIISKGYRFDYGSGPAIDDPAMIYASLIHDALYDLIQAGALPKRYRKDADKLLRRMLKEAGASRFRAWYVYTAVRVGYPIARFFKGLPDD